jgi:hypothetical protein
VGIHAGRVRLQPGEQPEGLGGLVGVHPAAVQHGRARLDRRREQSRVQRPEHDLGDPEVGS